MKSAGIILMLLAVTSPARGEIFASSDGRFRLDGDARLRVEGDWDSSRADGSRRADRARLRMRARLGLQFSPSEPLVFRLRGRTGNEGSQQSPHITLLESAGSPGVSQEFHLDQWFLGYSRARLQARAGRMPFPLFLQNEFLWDADVTPAGVSLTAGLVDRPLHQVEVRAAWMSPPDGMTRLMGSLAAAQVVARHRVGAGRLTAAAGYLLLDGEPGAVHLRNGNGARTYRVAHLLLQWSRQVAGRPLEIGLDFMENLESYPATGPDLFAAGLRDQTSGHVFQVRYGRTEGRGDWMTGYTYARMEALAVNAAYAQDDWIRWGSATQTDGTDLKGHELRAAVGLSPRAGIMLRVFLVEALTSVQDGRRVRLDLNLRF